MSQKLDPELVNHARVERRLDRLAWILDSVIPLPGGFRLGVDSIAGLIPGIGDGATALISTYMMVEGVRANAPKSVLARMLGNIAIDTAVGAIPFVGDLFDIGFRSNYRNVNLLRRYLDKPEVTNRASIGLLLFLVLMVIAMVVAAMMVAAALVKSIIGLF